MKDSYEGIEDDIEEMVNSGEIIGISNYPDLIMYPRNQRFLTRLSGDFKLCQGSNIVQTFQDNQKEIRRGDAVKFGDVWYRISSVIRSAPIGKQPIRAKPPASVSSLIEMNNRNDYLYNYTDSQLPLSKVVDALPPKEVEAVPSEQIPNLSPGPANNSTVIVHGFKYGCTNDLREKWQQTFEHMKTKEILGNDRKLEQELLKADLIQSAGIFTNDIKKRQAPTTNALAVKRPRMNNRK